MSTSVRRYNTDLSSVSRYSEDSQDSQSTAPSSLSNSPQPSLHRAATDTTVYKKASKFGGNSYDDDLSPCTTYCPRSSTETYASTVASQEVLYAEPEELDYEVPEYTEVVEADLRPSTPSDFADLFPSTRRLFIHHDDTTYDGNMNLRVDTEVGSGLHKSNIQLFHMRMHDLKAREFSLRRYCRDSGREVCHSSRMYTKPATGRRPGIQRSVSNAFASIRGKPELKRSDSGSSSHSSRSMKSIKRQDSGYGSYEDDFEEDDAASFMSESKGSVQSPTNTTKLEFSNYAQVEVKRRGAKSKKRYDFEYWGYSYTWKRITQKDGAGKAVSYHLFKGDEPEPVAHIVPELRSPSQVRHDEDAGGWVPPCSMWISDSTVLEALTDVADVIVATGLIALIDDCIKRHFRSESNHTHQLSLPLTPLKVDMEFVGPRAMVEHMFKRRNSGASTKEKEQRGSPLKFTSYVETH